MVSVIIYRESLVGTPKTKVMCNSGSWLLSTSPEAPEDDCSLSGVLEPPSDDGVPSEFEHPATPKIDTAIQKHRIAHFNLFNFIT